MEIDKALYGKYLPKFSWTKIQRHILVKQDASPDDADLATYWQHRAQQTTKMSLHPKYHWLAPHQQYRCPVCGELLANGESIERHHIILNKRDPARDDPRNMRLDGDSAAEARWTRDTRARMERFASPEVYINFLGETDNQAVRASYGGNYERLVAIKSRYDRDNLFHRNQNIQPR
jgi:hypothetical protein